jgi:hypothetical protein
LADTQNNERKLVKRVEAKHFGRADEVGQFLKCSLSALLLVAAGVAQAQLVNGNFATGDLTGWTLFNTPQGGSAITPQVVLFDTAGTGAPVNSAEFEVGQTSFPFGVNGNEEGAGIYQNVSLVSGQLNISLDIAASDTNPSVGATGNVDAGTFELILDGNVVASDDFGYISVSQTLRSTLSYSGAVTAGTHEITIETLRKAETVGDDTPYQYLANVSLGVTPVPEPGMLGLLALSGILLGSIFPLRLRGWFHDRFASASVVEEQPPNTAPEPTPTRAISPHSRLTRLVARLIF